MDKPGFIVPPPGMFPANDENDEGTARVRPAEPLVVVPPMRDAPAATQPEDVAPPTGPSPAILAIPAFVPATLGTTPIPPRPPVGAEPVPAAPDAPAPDAPAPSGAAAVDAPPPAPAPESAAPAEPTVPAPAASAPAASAPAASAPAQSVTGWHLRLADGQRMPVTGSLVLGRDPAPVTRRASTMVSVVDPARSVSKSHALVELSADDTLSVTDLHSTNGVSLVGADGRRTILGPGIGTPVRAPAPTAQRPRRPRFEVSTVLLAFLCSTAGVFWAAAGRHRGRAVPPAPVPHRPR